MRLRELLCGVLASCLVLATLPARAELIESGELLSRHSAIAHQETVSRFLARDDVRRHMEALGVDAAQAAERVAALTDAEVRALAHDIDELPAGAGALELVVIVLLVLIVLELLGAIDIFTKI